MHPRRRGLVSHHTSPPASGRVGELFSAPPHSQCGSRGLNPRTQPPLSSWPVTRPTPCVAPRTTSHRRSPTIWPTPRGPGAAVHLVGKHWCPVPLRTVDIIQFYHKFSTQMRRRRKNREGIFLEIWPPSSFLRHLNIQSGVGTLLMWNQAPLRRPHRVTGWNRVSNPQETFFSENVTFA